MNRVQYLLCKLAEEASEISQIALKSQQFGLEETYIDKSNKERCHMEIDDLMGVIEVLNREFNFNYTPNSARIIAKGEKIDRYYFFSGECGQIKEE